MTQASEFIVQSWVNTTESPTLQDLRGRVVLIKAFQMLCPSCVSLALPQAQEVHRTFSQDDVVVLGLHTVFEHHATQGSRAALEAFVHEYRFTFPVAIDAPSETGPIPRTMAAYEMQGTPTTILIDRSGKLRLHQFGLERDLALGARIASLLGEPATLAEQPATSLGAATGCKVQPPAS